MTPDFWLRLALASLYILGVWTLFQPKMLLQEFGDWLTWFLGRMAVKPLFSCPMCMASLHGTLIWFLTGGGLSWVWPLFVLSLCGLMRLIVGNLLKDV